MQARSQQTSRQLGKGILALVGSFLIFGGLPQVFAEESFQVAVVDPQAVMENSNSGQKALATLKEHVAVRQKLLETDAVELQKLEQELQNGETRSESETQVLQEQLQRKVQDYQRRSQTFQQELAEKQKAILTEYMKKIEVATQAVAKRRGVSMVVDKGHESTMKIVIYSAEGMDITDEVVKEFNELYK